MESDPEYKRKKKSQANKIGRLHIELTKDEKQLVSELNKSLNQGRVLRHLALDQEVLKLSVYIEHDRNIGL